MENAYLLNSKFHPSCVLKESKGFKNLVNVKFYECPYLYSLWHAMIIMAIIKINMMKMRMVNIVLW